MKPIAEQLINLGLVKPEDTPQAKAEANWRRRQAEQEIDICQVSAEPLPSFEAPALTRAKGSAPGHDRLYEPESKPSSPDSVKRVRGQMVWLHKSAPVLEIEGRPGLSPEEMAKGRRR